MKKITCLAALLISIMQFCYAQYRITGTIKDEQQHPLPHVTITVGKNLLTTISDSSGNYSFAFSSKSMSLSFSHVGYEPQTIAVKEENVPIVFMARSSGFLAGTVVTAFERNRNIKNIAAAVTVLTKASLERYNNESFVPALNTVPGVKMDERSPGSYRLSIRGNLLRSTFGVRNVKVYWNGIPFTDATGNTYFNELSINQVGRIEVLRGPSGSMYGSGTGGVILLKSELDNIKKKEVVLQANAGSYGLAGGAVSLNNTNDHTAITLMASHQQSDGYRHHTSMRRDVINFTGTRFVNAKQNISANIFYSDLYYQTPGALTQAEVNKNPKMARPAAGIFRSAEEQKAALYLTSWYGGLAHDYRFNSNWSNTTAVYATNTAFKNPTIRNYELKTEQGVGLRSVLKYQRPVFAATVGGEYQYGFTNTATYGNRLGERDTLQYHDDINTQQFNIFLQTDINLPANMILNAGVSYNSFYYGFSRVSNPYPVKESSGFAPQFVPRISLLKKIINIVSLYTSVSKGYSPPTIDEIHAGDGRFNRQLNAETAISFEAGARGDIVNGKIYFDISGYLLKLDNTIVSRRDASGGDYFVNAGRTRQTGLESAVNYTVFNKKNGFTSKLNVWINYTNIRARFVQYEQGASKYDGNKLTGTPSHVIVCGADMYTRPGFYANLTYSYTGKIPVNDANSFYASAYNLFFSRLGYKAGLSRSIDVDVYMAYQKSFNNPYSLGNDLNAAANRYYNPAVPQHFSGGIKLVLAVK